ncbi:hypothetical protein [Nocardia cyriacigeorgica]|uniref:hypothetical protein n=1 Tax=Nocardia cyriacigeorgica TaxID=135487 RepID=UPI001E47E84A|nr:hypothetical protein [Nocardia cyriacigeorgica]
MQETWTGAEATALRLALDVSQRRFAEKSGVAVATVKKWASRGAWLTLSPDCAAIMDTMLARATDTQRSAFLALSGREPGNDATHVTWTGGAAADCIAHACDLTRRDLMLDRRQAARALLGVALGANLIDNIDRWLFTDQRGDERIGASVGQQEVEELETTARAFRDWDDQFGGGLRRKAVVGQLSEVTDLVREGQAHAVDQRLRSVMAQLAETAATMSWDSGQQGTAQQYYALAARAASSADDPAFCANALAGMARQLLSLEGKTGAGEALEMIRLGLDRGAGRLTPAVESMLRTREAWAYGQLERPSAFRRACAKAIELHENIQTEAEPFWIDYFDKAELFGTLGGRLLELARRSPTFASEAADQIAVAVALRRPDRLRSAALDQLGLAEARLIQGELEEGCRIGHDALTIVERTRSDRVRVKAAKVLARTQRVKDVAVVAELRDRLRPLVAT